MKKILSLLSMLMITVMAFAGSYSDALHFEVNLMGAKAVDLPNGTLTIEKRVDGTYNVTAEGCDFTQYEMGNWGEFVCEEVAGTTDASGLTTIEVSNPYCYLTQSQYTFVNSTLVVKFNETKAYAHFNGTVAFNSFQKYPFQYTFGTDDFGSTGGGGTVETTEGPLVEAGLTPNGARIEAKPFTINWDTHKVVAKLDMTTCQGVNENALSFSNNAANLAEWNTSNGASLHFYYTKDAYVWNGTANVQLTNTFTIQFRNSDDLSTTPTKYVQVNDPSNVRVELRQDGVYIDGTLAFEASDYAKLLTYNDLVFGSTQGENRSNATYKYVEVVGLDWTEPTTPETPEAVVYKNTLKVVRNNETQTYEEAEVKVLAKEEGKYEVTIPAFSDMDGVPGQVGPVTFEATGTESEGNTVLTAENQEFTLTNVGWNNDVVVVSMNGTIADGQLTGTFNVAFKNDASYTFNLYYGVEPPVEVTEVSNKDYTSNLRIYDSESESEENLFQADEATVNVVKYSDESYKITLKQITLNEQTADLVFTGTEQRATPYEEGGTVETEETMIVAKPDAATEAFLGGEGEEIGATFQIVNVSENEIKMALNISGNTFMYDGEFNYDQPEEPKEDYAINFEKDAKQTHASRYSTSVSLTVNGQAQTIEFGKTMNGYEDLTAQSFTVTPGAEVTPAIGYVGEWMHGYVYVDLNNDKQFSFNADSDDQTGTEVVSYSFYSASNGSTGLNSKGETVSNNCNVNPLPSFTAPAEEGTYRIRFKVDWNSVDAGGCVVSGNNILNNGGGIYDATLVVKDVTNGIDSINAEAANAELFTVDGVKISKLQKGLNIVRTADGKVKKVVIK